uniref:Uncharacterized mitochondrial protein AtMg00810-like n=1 Tax=Nicotiana tabacum TaxID=4097 RepID=A0A1S4ACC4_TOBAC
GLLTSTNKQPTKIFYPNSEAGCMDDISLTGNDLTKISALKDFLDEKFRIKDLGLLNYFFGNTVKLNYDVREPLPRPDTYMSLIGKLNFLTHTRPDLCFVVQHLRQFFQSPKVPHMTATLHVLRYLKGTSEAGLFLNNSVNFSLVGYCDGDWATCPDS